MAIDNINTTDNLNTGRVKLNQAIDQANLSEIDSAAAIATADGAVVIANTADAKSTTTQQQLDTVIIASGTSDAETIQARGGEPLLYNRLDKVDTQFAQTMNKNPIYLTDYGVSHIETASNNTTFINQALQDAQINGRPVIIPWVLSGQFININDELIIDIGGIEVFGYGRQSKIRQTIFPKKIFNVTGENTTIENFAPCGVVFDASGLGDTHVTYSGVYVNAHNVKVDKIYGDQISTVVNVVGSESDLLKGVEVYNINSTENVVFGLLFSGTDGLIFDNIFGGYKFLGNVPTPPHLIYASQAVGNNYNTDGRIALSLNGQGSYAFQFKGMIGGSVNTLKAFGSAGSLHVMESSNFKVLEVISEGDTHTSLMDGSLAIDGTNDGIVVDKATIKMASNGKPITIGDLTSNSTFKELDVTANHTTANTSENAIDVEIRGLNNKIDKVTSINVGTQRWIASIGVFTGEKIAISRPKTKGNMDGIIIRNSGNGNHLIENYRMKDFEDFSRRAMSIIKQTTLKPLDYTVDKRVVAYDKADIFSGSSSASELNLTTSMHQWVVPFGAFVVNGEYIKCTAGSGALAYIDLNTPDIDFSLTLKYGNRDAIVVRAIDRLNYIGARIDHTLNLAYIYKTEAGVITRLAEIAFTPQVGRLYDFRIVAFGSVVEFYVDNQKQASTTLDSGLMTTFGAIENHGILSLADANNRFYDLKWKNVS